jgi:hypothetical protein
MLRANNNNNNGQTNKQTKRTRIPGDMELRRDANMLENYSEQAAQDFALYQWLERNGKLPPPGKPTAPGVLQRYQRETQSGQSQAQSSAGAR